MGLGGISIWQLAIVLVIVVLIFGTTRLKSIGGDLGSAIKGFKRAMDSDDDKPGKDEPKSIESDKPDAEFAEQKDKSRNA